MLQTMPNIASVRDVQRNYKVLFDAVKQNKQPLYLLSNNKPQVVVLDINLFEDIVKKIQTLEENIVLNIVNEGLKEYKAGRAKTLRSLKDLI